MAFENVAFAGLGTLTRIAPAAGLYYISGRMSLPTVTNGGGQSSCVATVNLNGSPKYTGVAGAEGFSMNMVVAAADTITVVLSSAAAPDQGINNIKSVISFDQGV